MEIPARTIHLESSGSATQLLWFNYLRLRALTFLSYPLETLPNAYPRRTSPSLSGNCATVYCDTCVQERIPVGDRVETWGQISRYAGLEGGMGAYHAVLEPSPLEKTDGGFV